MTRHSRTLLLAASIACVSLAPVASAQASPAMPVPSVFVSAAGSDLGPCTRKAPCASLQRAYRAARPGHVVQVAGGSYGPQLITRDLSKRSSKHVTFRPAPKERVVLDGLQLGAGFHPEKGPKHLTIRGMRLSFASSTDQRPWLALEGTKDVRMIGIDAGSFYVRGVSDFRILGGDYGPCVTQQSDGRTTTACGANSKIDGPGTSSRVTIDGALFHDYMRGTSCDEPGNDCHLECLYVNASSNVTIRNSRFQKCGLFNIFFTISGTSAGHRKLLVENNWFDRPYIGTDVAPVQRRETAVMLAWCSTAAGTGYQDVVFRFNSFGPGSGIAWDGDTHPACRYDRVRVYGNILSQRSCSKQVVYAYNVVTGRACGGGDRVVASLPYVSASPLGAGGEFRLPKTRRTVADALVPRSMGCPARDIDGKVRPKGKACTAGSHERVRATR